jgi:hypothetical protein
MPESTSDQVGGGVRGQAQPENGALTDDLIRKVSEKVYAMLMHDLEIERERQRPSARAFRGKGGW